MTEDTSRKDIRRILKTFGVKADEAMIIHLARNPGVHELRVRITLEDLTEYDVTPPSEALLVVVEDIIQRQSDTI